MGWRGEEEEEERLAVPPVSVLGRLSLVISPGDTMLVAVGCCDFCTRNVGREETKKGCHHCAGMVDVMGDEEEREGGLENVIAVGLGKTNWFCPFHGEEYGAMHIELACV